MLRWLKRLLGLGPPAPVDGSIAPFARGAIGGDDVASPAPAPQVDHAVAIVSAIAAARTDILSRVADVNSLTEKEVIGAARGLGEVVACASRNRDETAQMVEMFRGGQAREGLARSLMRVTSHVEEHVARLVADAQAQETAAQKAQASTAGLIKASREIEALLQAAKILALNARIEANRGSAQDKAFRVVADEIKNLSDVIAKTNAMVQDLADGVAKTLAALLHGSIETCRSAETFAEASRHSLEAVRGEATAFQKHADRAMGVSENGMAEIVRASQGALSSLQFQDVVAQGLLRIDHRLHDLQVEVAEHTGQTALVADVAPAAHVEMGGDKPIFQARTGEITFF
jgi:methyl-accepting chemotaxis protein